MKNIITVTLNPAIDRVVKVPDFHIGAVQVSVGTQVYPAGKGVNVARALSCMGKPATAIGIIGKDNAGFFENIKLVDMKGDLGEITLDWVFTETPTRTNCTLIDPIRGTETHVREVINTLEPFPMDEVVEAIKRHCGEGDVVVFSGSLPKNAPADTYYRLCLMCKSLGAKVLIDSSGDALKESLKAAPDLIKPNVEELQELVGHKFYTKAEIFETAATLARTYGIRYVMVSMGDEGAMIHADDGKGQVEDLQAVYMQRLPGQLHTVGSGDAMVAAASTCLAQEADTQDFLALGMAAGVANLLTEGPGLVSLADMKGCIDAIEINRIN